MADILNKLASCFETAFKADPSTITMDTLPDQVEGWDSLGHTQLVNAIEKEFGLSPNRIGKASRAASECSSATRSWRWKTSNRSFAC